MGPCIAKCLFEIATEDESKQMTYSFPPELPEFRRELYEFENVLEGMKKGKAYRIEEIRKPFQDVYTSRAGFYGA
jgi:hypothetical protein